MKTNHEIDYKIIGDEMQCVEIELDPQETVIAEAGSFMMMEQDIQMETIFGDGSRQQGDGTTLRYARCDKGHRFKVIIE